MKKLALVISLLFSVCAFAQIENVTPKRPSPPRLVNDFANTLTPDQAEALEHAEEREEDVLRHTGEIPGELLIDRVQRNVLEQRHPGRSSWSSCDIRPVHRNRAVGRPRGDREIRDELRVGERNEMVLFPSHERPASGDIVVQPRGSGLRGREHVRAGVKLHQVRAEVLTGEVFRINLKLCRLVVFGGEGESGASDGSERHE